MTKPAVHGPAKVRKVRHFSMILSCSGRSGGGVGEVGGVQRHLWCGEEGEEEELHTTTGRGEGVHGGDQGGGQVLGEGLPR